MTEIALQGTDPVPVVRLARREGLRLRDVLYRNANLYAADRAVVCAKESVSWRDFALRVNRLANRLTAAGVGHGDRVGLLQQNGPEIPEIYFAAALLGAVTVPMSHRLSAEEARFILADAEVTFLFLDSAYTLDDIEIPVVRTRHPAYAEFRQGGTAEAPPAEESDADPVLLLYTSGTTGRPKGALHTQAGMIENAWHIMLAQGLRHEDVFCSSTPLTHAAAATRVFSMALDGLCHVILERFTPELFCDVVETFGVTSTILVPTMLADLIDWPELDRRDLSSLRFIVYGAAPSSIELVKRAMARLPCGLVHGYGLTESGPGLTIMTAHEHRSFIADPSLTYRLASVGRPVAGVAVKLVSEEGGEVEPGEAGELLVRSNKSMTGYWRRPEATQEAFRDDWLATGDIARADEAGFLYLVDRKKDLIISGGLNIYPSEIERVLLGDESVNECAVVAASDARWGETPVAVVAPVTAHAHIDRLIQLCRDQLAGYKQPRRILFTETLPRNANGKISKLTLRAAVANVAEGATVLDVDA